MARRKSEPARPPSRARGHVVALDTNCLIALVCGWHEHHGATTSLVEARLQAGAVLAIPAPALIEAYSVLTRLPAPQRLAPADALELLRQNFRSPARLVVLGPLEVWAFLGAAETSGVHGGRTYDALIAACARKAKARELVTLNLRHFESFADESLMVISPAKEPARSD